MTSAVFLRISEVMITLFRNDSDHPDAVLSSFTDSLNLGYRIANLQEHENRNQDEMDSKEEGRIMDGVNHIYYVGWSGPWRTWQPSRTLVDFPPVRLKRAAARWHCRLRWTRREQPGAENNGTVL